MILAEKLSKRFDDLLAVDGVSLEIMPGGIAWTQRRG
jgi:ABC-type branched-subunit amino acid transport system ATPase component